MKGIYWHQLLKTIMTQSELKKKLKTENISKVLQSYILFRVLHFFCTVVEVVPVT